LTVSVFVPSLVCLLPARSVAVACTVYEPTGSSQTNLNLVKHARRGLADHEHLDDLALGVQHTDRDRGAGARLSVTR